MITMDERSTDSSLRLPGSKASSRAKTTVSSFPRLEQAIAEHGPISILVHIETLKGVELGALWEELKFDLRHSRDFERMALVGDKSWHERAMRFAAHFVPGDARFFPSTGIDNAWGWILSGNTAATAHADGTIEGVPEPADEEGDIDEADDAESDGPATPVRDQPVRRILLATDFLTGASAAAEWAVALAARHGAQLTVFHVAPMTLSASLPLELQKEITVGLDAVASDARRAGVDVRTTWKSGRPWEVIAEEATAHDLVVIGARKHAALHHPLGSTADRVLRMSPVPVLTVHPGIEMRAMSPQKVLVPADFSETATLALETAMRLLGPAAREDGADQPEITLLHAWQPLVDYGDGYMAFPQPNPMAESREQAETMLDGLASRLEGEGVKVRPVVRQGYPAKVVAEEASVRGVDLIAMGTHGHSGLARLLLGSIAERVVHRVTCPVLTVGPVGDVDENEELVDAEAPLRQEVG